VLRAKYVSNEGRPRRRRFESQSGASADIYQDRADHNATLGQPRKALEISRVRPGTGSYADELFESLITGRGGHRVADLLEEKIRALGGEPSTTAGG